MKLKYFVKNSESVDDNERKYPDFSDLSRYFSI